MRPHSNISFRLEYRHDHASDPLYYGGASPRDLSGRYIPDLDHHVPDDVSWPNFRHYATRLRAMIVG